MVNHKSLWCYEAAEESSKDALPEDKNLSAYMNVDVEVGYLSSKWRSESCVACGFWGLPGLHECLADSVHHQL